jgi:hypothetical protein
MYVFLNIALLNASLSFFCIISVKEMAIRGIMLGGQAQWG